MPQHAPSYAMLRIRPFRRRQSSRSVKEIAYSGSVTGVAIWRCHLVTKVFSSLVYGFENKNRNFGVFPKCDPCLYIGMLNRTPTSLDSLCTTYLQ